MRGAGTFDKVHSVSWMLSTIISHKMWSRRKKLEYFWKQLTLILIKKQRIWNAMSNRKLSCLSNFNYSIFLIVLFWFRNVPYSAWIKKKWILKSFIVFKSKIGWLHSSKANELAIEPIFDPIPNHFKPLLTIPRLQVTNRVRNITWCIQALDSKKLKMKNKITNKRTDKGLPLVNFGSYCCEIFDFSFERANEFL
jgi:hypothetical protein